MIILVRISTEKRINSMTYNLLLFLLLIILSYIGIKLHRKFLAFYQHLKTWGTKYINWAQKERKRLDIKTCRQRSMLEHAKKNKVWYFFLTKQVRYFLYSVFPYMWEVIITRLFLFSFEVTKRVTWNVSWQLVL